MYCKFCGKKTYKTKTVCRSCAKKIRKRTQPRRRINALVISVVLLLLLVLGLAAFWVHFFTKSSLEESVAASFESILKKEKESLLPDSIGTRIADAHLDRVSYNIVSANSDYATISVRSPDLQAIYIAALHNAGNEIPTSMEEYDEYVDTLLQEVYVSLERQDCPARTADVTVSLSSDYQIELSQELADALWGGLLSLQGELIHSYAGGDGR